MSESNNINSNNTNTNRGNSTGYESNTTRSTTSQSSSTNTTSSTTTTGNNNTSTGSAKRWYFYSFEKESREKARREKSMAPNEEILAFDTPLTASSAASRDAHLQHHSNLASNRGSSGEFHLKRKKLEDIVAQTQQQQPAIVTATATAAPSLINSQVGQQSSSSSQSQWYPRSRPQATVQQESNIHYQNNNNNNKVSRFEIFRDNLGGMTSENDRNRRNNQHCSSASSIGSRTKQNIMSSTPHLETVTATTSSIASITATAAAAISPTFFFATPLDQPSNIPSVSNSTITQSTSAFKQAVSTIDITSDESDRDDLEATRPNNDNSRTKVIPAGELTSSQQQQDNQSVFVLSPALSLSSSLIEAQNKSNSNSTSASQHHHLHELSTPLSSPRSTDQQQLVDHLAEIERKRVVCQRIAIPQLLNPVTPKEPKDELPPENEE